MWYRCTRSISLLIISTMIILLSQTPGSSAMNNTTAALTEAVNGSYAEARTVENGPTTTTQPNPIPEVVMTLAFVGLCALLGIGIAKLGDYCYDRRMATRDDISNASEYTKNILRQRLAVMKMKQDPETDDGKTVKKAASAWIETTVSKKKTEGADNSIVDNSAQENKTEKSKQENTEGDQEKGLPVPQTTTNDGKESAATPGPQQSLPVTVTITSDTGSKSPLPINKVSPSDKTGENLTRGNVLPPIGQRPRTANRPINQPIRSTR